MSDKNHKILRFSSKTDTFLKIWKRIGGGGYKKRRCRRRRGTFFLSTFFCFQPNFRATKRARPQASEALKKYIELIFIRKNKITLMSVVTLSFLIFFSFIRLLQFFQPTFWAMKRARPSASLRSEQFLKLIYLAHWSVDIYLTRKKAQDILYSYSFDSHGS